jgi:Fe-S cluster biosynthesis and repair protein YggX
MDMQARIEQFRKMANDDPNNELGHFSLGRAYLDAGMYDGAIAAFQRALDINPNLSKAYQSMAFCLLRLEKKDLAIEQLARGVQVAHERGEMMPKNDMIAMLKELGAPVPDLKNVKVDVPVGEGQVLCSRCGQVGPKLPSPPFSNKQGKLIQEKVCQPCWREWITMGTKVINELRLPLADPAAQRIFDQHMMEFLNLAEAPVTKPPQTA